MQKNGIILIIGAVITISIMLINIPINPINEAWAIAVSSRTYAGATTQQGYGKLESLDYVIQGADDGANCNAGTGLYVMSGSTLAGIHNFTGFTRCPGAESNNILHNNIACVSNTNVCYFWEQIGISVANVIIGSALMQSPWTLTQYSNTTYASCQIRSMVLAGGAIYSIATNCASFAGIWKITPSYINDGITGNDNQIIARPVGLKLATVPVTPSYDGGCYDSVTNKAIFISGGDTSALVISVNSDTYDGAVSLGAVALDVYCPNDGYAIVTLAGSIKVINMATRGVVTTTMGTSTMQHSILHGTDLFISHSSNSTISVFTYSQTTSMVKGYSITGASASIALVKGNATRVNGLNLSENIFSIYDLQNDGSDSTPTDNTFCNNPANVNILRCKLEANGSAGALTGTSTLLNQSSTNIMCQIGVLQCTRDSDGNFIPSNADTKTNGVGYIMTIVALGVFVGILWVASRGDLTSIPTFVWFIGTIAVLGMATAFQFIDPTFLIIGVITVIAFAVAKARNVFGGQTLFAGEG